MKINVLFALLVILVLVISGVVIANYKRNKFMTDFLPGLWVADEKFCKDSGIDGMVVYISNDGDSGYMIMYANNAIVVEKKFSITWNWITSPLDLLQTDDIYTRNVSLDDLDSEEKIEKIMPKDITLELDPLKGNLRFMNRKESDDGTLYADLYKDNMASFSN